jgi:hypothetical protein
MNQEKKMLLYQIHEHILEKYRLADIPIIFQTMDCASDEWYGKNLSTGKLSKLKFVPSDMGTAILTLWSE